MPHLRKSPRTVSKDLRIAAVKGSAGTARWQAGSVNTEGADVEHHQAPVGGWCAAGWEPVREAFVGNFAERGEVGAAVHVIRSEEHTSELQSLMRISYAVFC